MPGMTQTVVFSSTLRALICRKLTVRVAGVRVSGMQGAGSVHGTVVPGVVVPGVMVVGGGGRVLVQHRGMGPGGSSTAFPHCNTTVATVTPTVTPPWPL